jgi:hypothetical protein
MAVSTSGTLDIECASDAVKHRPLAVHGGSEPPLVTVAGPHIDALLGVRHWILKT